MTFDITTLKESQQRQARVGRQLRAITENLPVLISYIDKGERYVFSSMRPCWHWLEIEPATLIGRPLAESMTPASTEAWV